MEVHFNDPYDRLEIDSSFDTGLPTEVVSRYRNRLQLIRAARDERDLAAMRCLQLTPLSANPGDEFSIRLADGYCLVIAIRKRAESCRASIVDIRTDIA